MKNKKLKSALETAYMQEFDQFPSQQELEDKYSFSKAFIAEMEELIKSVNKTYIVLFDHPVQKNALVLILAATIIIPVGWLYYLGKIDRNRTKLIIVVAEIIIASVFGVSVRKAGRSFTRSYKTAFTDNDEDEQTTEHQLDFAMPVPPADYSKTGEYRTTVSHMVEFKDGLGRVILYNRVDIQQGVLTKIDTANATLNKTDINGTEAVTFGIGAESNVIWADKYYRYHLKGDCSVEVLIEMAKTI